MAALDAIRDAVPEVGKDMRLNLSSVVLEGGGSPLSDAQRWGTAVACAHAAGHRGLAKAVEADARAAVSEGVVEDARAAAVMMAMNNVYYRFRSMVEKPTYSERPARLRMGRMARLAGEKADFELFCLAVSALNGCASCVRSHEEAVLTNGLSEDHVHDAVRIAATIQGLATALSLDEG